MNKSHFTKEKLLTYLLIVSIITVALIGLYFIQQHTSNTLINVFNAMRAVFIPFIIAFFLSFIIGPISTWMQRILHFPKTISIFLAILIGIAFIGGILILMVAFIISQLSGILSSLVTLIDNVAFERIITDLIDAITLYLNSTGINDIITEISENGASIEKLFAFIGSALLVLMGIGSSIINLIVVLALTPVFMFYLIKEKNVIFQGIAMAAPKSMREHVIELGKRSDVVIRNYFRGQGLMMLIVSVIFVISMSILSFFIPDFSLRHALIFGLIMGMFNIIPYLGAWLGISAPIIFLLSLHLQNQQSLEPSNIYLIAIIVVVSINLVEQIIESSVIQPYVMGKQVQIHPLTILASFIFFGGVFGFVGVLLAVPLAGTIKAALLYFGEQNEKNRIICNYDMDSAMKIKYMKPKTAKEKKKKQKDKLT